MKKIMFNDRYGLTSAVLSKSKTTTRRLVKLPDGMQPEDVWNPNMGIDERGTVYFTIDSHANQYDIYPQYQPGEVVAVAQSYKTIYDTMEEADGNSKANGWWCELHDHIGFLDPTVTPGYRNKMFVNVNFMPHRLRITNVGIERLQDITDINCLREGVERWMDAYIVAGIMEYGGKSNRIFDTPRQAFLSLIDHISGHGTWDKNPWVFTYDFELVR